MPTRVQVDNLLQIAAERPVFDVRTPAEFSRGHIPHALNLPLFSDDERVVVGTIYKQIGPEEALRKGLEFVGPKMRFFVEEVERLAPDKKIALHCWRGGRRSDSLGWLLEFAGFDVVVLEGGYKAYRNHLLNWFEQTSLPLLVLGGYTGSGKTEILQELARQGEQIVDLEGLAHHKGSAFGALGEAPQPSVEQFENALYDAFRNLDLQRRIWIENESRAIGRCFLPEGLWRQKEGAPVVHVDVPLPIRVHRLVEGYACYEKNELVASFQKIAKRLGGQHLNAALEALERDDFSHAAAIALEYYDKAYHHSLNRRQPLGVYQVTVDRNDPALAASLVRELVDREPSILMTAGISA